MMPELAVLDVDTPEGAAVLAELAASGGTTLLAGSAISSWDPSRIPPGQAINRAFATLLAANTVAPGDLVRGMIEKTAFEHLMECSPHEARLRAIFADAFHPVPANPVHGAIVELVARRTIRHVVTTNYDTGLEAAAAGALLPVRDAGEADAATGALPILFKIHGCASAPATLVFTLRHEHRMDGWKREMLARLTRGGTLLVMGYSGLDFELCPELPQMNASRVLWGHFDPDFPRYHPAALLSLTANARRVLEETGGTVLYGDLVRILERMGAPPIGAKWSAGEAEFVARIGGAFSHEDMDRWRMRLYNAIGCARDAQVVAERRAATSADEGMRLEAEIEHARSLFHMGAYRTAVATYTDAALKAEHWRGGALLSGALHGLAESARVGGWFRIAHAAVARLDRHAETVGGEEKRRSLRAEAAFLRVLLLRNYYQVAARARLVPLKLYLRRRALRLLRIAVPQAVETGDWPALQQGALWAERLGIGFAEIHDGPRLPLPSMEGYRQLGYFLASMMAIRDGLDAGMRNPADVEDAADLLRRADAIGNYPEVWKFAAAYGRAGGTLPADVQALAVRARRRCEHGLLRRSAYRLGIR